MDGTGEYHLSEVSQAQKAKGHMFSLIYGIQTQQAILYIERHIYRTCTQKWGWQRSLREEERKERKIANNMKYILSM
jgi:hypothetical protein